MELHSKILRPWFRKDLGIIESDLIGTGHRVRVLNAFDHMERVAVIADCRVRRSVERPLAEADGIDHKSVSLPMSNRVAHPQGTEICIVRAAVRKNLMADGVVFEKQDHFAGRLNNLR